jgi:hypothetical protein
MPPALDDLPPALRTWAAVNAVVDVGLGSMLLLVPESVLPRLGWTAVDPVTSRLLGAALLSLGWQALVLRRRRGGHAAFRALLGLRLVGSAAALVGMLIAIARGAPGATWAILAALVAASGVWAHYAIRLRQLDGAAWTEGEPDAPDDDDPAVEDDATTDDLGPAKTPS